MQKIFKGIHRRILNLWLDFYIPILYFFGKKSGLYKGNERKEKIIVSLTSFTPRMNTVHLTIETILKQSVKPDEIHLYLAEWEFSDKILPLSLERMKSRGLRVIFCEDLKSHNKYYHAIKDNPSAIVITVDDDCYYPKKMIENLMEKHIEFPNAVAAILVKDMLPLKSVAHGVGGVLYPPNCLPQEAFNKKAIMELAPLADDVWLKVMEMLNDVPVVATKIGIKYLYVKNSHKKEALHFINVGQNKNDEQIQNLLKVYKVITQGDRKINDKL